MYIKYIPLTIVIHYALTTIILSISYYIFWELSTYLNITLKFQHKSQHKS